MNPRMPWLARQSAALTTLLLALVTAGCVAALSLPVGLFPQVAFPRVVIDLDAGDRPADQTALLLTRPVEEAIRTVPGVAGLRSESTRGSAQISVDFGWGRDMVASTLSIDAAIAKALPDLPAGTRYAVRRMDPTVYPIISYALQSERLSPVALRDLAAYRIVPLLASVPGLARVDVQGGETAEWHVEADPGRLASYGLTLTDIADALNRANVLQAVGRSQDRNKLYLVVAHHTLDGADALGQVVLKTQAHGWVKLSDVATVKPGYAPQWQKVAEDGRTAVLFNVYEQPDGNAVQVARDVRTRLADMRLPPGVTLKNWYDQSELVLASAHSVRDAVTIGLVLAALVLWLFLRSSRVTLIALLVAPATLAIACLLLQLTGQTLNIMTLGGMAAAVGLVIDDAIVMIEHIARRSSATTDSHGVFAAAKEFLPPLSGSSLATLIVFLPLSFLDGVTGAFAKALSIAMACTLMVSWAMSAWVVPPLAAKLIDFQRWHDPGLHDRHPLRRVHAWLYDRLVQRPRVLIVCVALLALLGYIGYRQVPTGFMPAVDESGFVMDYYTRPGTSLPETEREIAQVEDILKSMPEIDTFSRRLGTGLGGDLGQSYHGDFFVRLKPDRVRSTENVMADVRERIEQSVPGVEVELAQLMEDLIGDLTAVPQPIEIKLYATDGAGLQAQAQRVTDAIASIPGIVDVKNGVQLAGDALDIAIDPDKAALESVTVEDVQQSISAALSGIVATVLPQATKAVAVRVQMPGAMHARIADIAALPLRAADGHVFTLSRVANLTTVTGQPQISRENLQPMATVTARIEGRGLGAAVADVRATLARNGVLDAGVRYELGGLYQQQQAAFIGLSRVFGMALAAEFVLLLVLYQRVRLAATIMGSALLSSSAVFVALWLCHVDFNVTAMMGMTMIVGMSTEMAIFYVSEYRMLAEHMDTRAALRAASVDRLRPITMTTLAAMLTLAPLALALGPGAGMQQPLAIAIMAGLLLQYPLVLLAMPAVLALWERPRRGERA